MEHQPRSETLHMTSPDIHWGPSNSIKRSQTRGARTHIGVSRNVYMEQFIFHVIQTAE